jgi:hypothetical protein
MLKRVRERLWVGGLWSRHHALHRIGGHAAHRYGLTHLTLLLPSIRQPLSVRLNLQELLRALGLVGFL